MAHFEIVIDDVPQLPLVEGETEEAANIVAARLRQGPSQKILVREVDASASAPVHVAAPLASDAEVLRSFNELAAERDDLARQAQQARDQRDAFEARVVELEKAAAEKAAAEKAAAEKAAAEKAAADSTPDKTTIDAKTKK